MRPPFRLSCEPPLLVVRFDEPMQTLGWPVLKPGFASAREIVWLEVRDGDLRLDVDPVALLKEKLAAESLLDAAAFMTSRDIRRHEVKQCSVGAITATCVATVGLSNAESVGSRREAKIQAFGTINTLVHVSSPLAQAAFIEAISIATQARTAAIMETSPAHQSPPVTGTGTDCIIVAAPKGGRPADCAGLHTDIGEAIGAAVYDAIFAGATQWWAETTPFPAAQKT
jgi:adenosylcobinamide amidohydrolase